MKHSKIVLMIITGLLIITTGCTMPDQISNAKTSSAPAQTASTQNTADLTHGWNPQEACAFLSGVAGFQTRGYKNLIDDGSGEAFSCSSPYLDLDSSFPLSNHIAYYVDGKAQTANVLKLVLNINSAPQAKQAHAMLLVSSQQLTQKALSAALPKDVSSAITSGKAGKWTVGKGDVELKREDFPTGKGYELHYIIRKKV
jgi:hypothetical protein